MLLLVHSKPARLIGYLFAAGIAIFSLSRSWPGLLLGFSLDDMMNLHGAWEQPWPGLIIANLTPFTSSYRPMGALVYRAVFELAGLSPLAFRIVAYLLLFFNVWLVYRLAALLSESKEIGALAALMFVYHPKLEDLYLNTGTLYDLLAAAFYLSALIYYTGIRKRQPGLTATQTAVLCGLSIAAFNSKEMALTLPALLIAYEIVWHPLHALKERRAVWLLSAIAVAAALAKMSRPGPFRENPAYALDLSWEHFVATSTLWLGRLFYLPEQTVNAVAVVAIYAGLLLLAIALCSKLLLFFAIFVIVTPLPVNFIPVRGVFVMYLPLAGWAICLSALLVWAKNRISPGAAATAALFAAVACGLWLLQRGGTDQIVWDSNRDILRNPITNLHDDLRRIHPQMARGAKVLFLDDGFDRDTWTPVFVVRLYYRDRNLEVERTKTHPAWKSRIDRYDHIFDYRDGRYVEVKHHW